MCRFSISRMWQHPLVFPVQILSSQESIEIVKYMNPAVDGVVILKVSLEKV